MTVDTGTANLAVSTALVEAFAASGLRHAVICPGSRSTPLAVAFASCPHLKTWVLIDERSAAYFALGMARQLHAPVAILSTSGSAAANFLPAVVEASLSRIPLVVLTADRPPELRGWGAAQTIDQINLYGSHAKWFADLPVPDGEPSLLRHVRSAAARAMQTAAAPPAGPVHLNVPFREPLLPNDVADRQWTETFSSVDLSMDISSAIADVVSSSLVEASSQLAAAVRNEPKGIVVAGPMEGKKLAAALSDFSAVSGYPVLADPLSGARFGPHRPCSAIDSYDSFLRDSEIADALAPEIVIRVGAIPTSKPLQQFLAAHPGNQHLLIDPGPPRDPLHLGTSHLYADPAVVLEQVTEFLGESHHRLDPCWLAKWQCADRLASEAITSGLTAGDELSEGRTLSEIAAALPEAAILVVGNSMPVRDADAFIRGDRRNIAIVANRGANGIDGVISSALGAAAVASEPTVLVIGDLSFYHDMNGLFAAQQFGITATIVVLNNNGGGIFSFLPQAGLLDEQTFERLFGTPIGLDVQRAAELYGAAYARPATWPAFRDSLARAIGSPQLSIVEVITDRARNVLQHRAISARVSEAMRRAQVAGV